MESKPRRRYTLGRRAEAAAETRQRLVDATAALHAEKGISGTSLREIALRAGMSIGTVYHHFPTYDDAIRACGEHTMRLHPAPDLTIFTRGADVEARVSTFVREMFRFFDRCPWIEQLRLDRARFKAVDEGMSLLDEHIARLAHVALGANDSAAATLIAISDITPFHLLRKSGMSVDEAAARISELFLTWHDGHNTARARAAKANKKRRTRP